MKTYADIWVRPARLRVGIYCEGHLPSTWTHDSLRAAATENTPNHHLMQIPGDLDAQFGPAPRTFQHMWTTTSTTSDNLNKESFVFLRLHAHQETDRLFKRTFVTELREPTADAL